MTGGTLLADFFISLLASVPLALVVVVGYARRRQAGKILRRKIPRGGLAPAE